MLHLCDVTFSIAVFDAVATRETVNFSDRISIEKVVSENVDRKSDFFDSIRRVILPKIEKEQSFSTAFFDSIRNCLTPVFMVTKNLYENLDLTQDSPNKILFHFLWEQNLVQKS